MIAKKTAASAALPDQCLHCLPAIVVMGVLWLKDQCLKTYHNRAQMFFFFLLECLPDLFFFSTQILGCDMSARINWATEIWNRKEEF